MWCAVKWCDVMWCHVLSCNVIWCDGLQWQVMWSDVMSCDLMWNDAMGWSVMWVGIWCDSMWLCDVVDRHMMCCELRRPHNRKTHERSRPIRGETLGCKTQKKKRGLMSQYHDSVLQSITPYENVTMTFMFGSCKLWDVPSIVRSNAWDTEHERHSCFLVITPESSSLIITVTTITIIVPGACRAPQVQITQRISIVPLYTGPGTIRFNGLILPNHSAAKWLCSSSLRVRAWSRLINWPVGST